jgi:hypothetical protein
MCFSFQWIATLLIWAVVIGAAFAILQVILRFALPKIKLPMVAEIVKLLIDIIKILIYAMVFIFLIIIAFDAIACLWSMAGGFPSLHRY